MTTFYTEFLLNGIFDPLFFRLMTLDNRYELRDREIGFILPNNVWVRNEVFSSKQALIDYLVQKTPLVIQLGGIWPKSKPRNRLLAKEKLQDCISEIVLDIDFNVKHHVRDGICKCKGDKEICDLCWNFYMDIAQNVLEYLVYDVWQFKAVFKVFSGRRGFHIWILDERVHTWTYEERCAFYNSIDRLRDASDEISPVREHIWKNLIAPHAEKFPIMKRWFRYQSETTITSDDAERSEKLWREYCFQVFFPLLDKAVTCDSSHMKKMPLQLHSSTKNLCVVLMDRDRKPFVPSRDTRVFTPEMNSLYLKAGKVQIEKKLKLI